MNHPDSTHLASRLLVRAAVFGLFGIGAFAGCGDSSGPDPTIKVEDGKTIGESIRASPGAVKKHEAAPIQRTKAASK